LSELRIRKILDATKLTAVGVLTKTVQRKNGETIELTDQYYVAFYGIAYTPDKKPTPTVNQFTINICDCCTSNSENLDRNAVSEC